jgi:hypothetical protein
MYLLFKEIIAQQKINNQSIKQTNFINILYLLIQISKNRPTVQNKKVLPPVLFLFLD